MGHEQTEGGREESLGDAAKFGVLTVSDRASHGVYADLSGPAILKFFQEAIDSRYSCCHALQCSPSTPMLSNE